MSQTDKAPFLRIRDLVKTIGTQQILRGLDLEVAAGEILSLIGASGEGKSVLLKHVVGLMKPTSGSIQIDGQEISQLSERKFSDVRKKVGYMFQNGALFDGLSVHDNVAFPLRAARKLTAAEIEKRVSEALEVVELGDHGLKMPNEISGGMKKRVALARAIIHRPQCVLYDEPTAGLDPIVTDVIDKLILRLKHRYGMTGIIITHDMASVRRVSDRVAYLKQGEIYFLGTADELFASSDPLLKNFVQGRSGMTAT